MEAEKPLILVLLPRQSVLLLPQIHLCINGWGARRNTTQEQRRRASLFTAREAAGRCQLSRHVSQKYQQAIQNVSCGCVELGGSASRLGWVASAFSIQRRMGEHEQGDQQARTPCSRTHERAQQTAGQEREITERATDTVIPYMDNQRRLHERTSVCIQLCSATSHESSCAVLCTPPPHTHTQKGGDLPRLHLPRSN